MNQLIDPETGMLLENRKLWSSGMKGFASRLHAQNLLSPLRYGVWGGGSWHPWKWAAGVDGHYWRIGGDIYDNWMAVMRQWDAAYSVPSMQRFIG